ncbi:DUF2141 domain-containing protein [Blastomonas aquatica]|uniref:DUF2141 domain-containing protein n=1 Tax=Blastomonas aquatica TaxID=1510276 RepID=A0ABQ1JN57_9SPHN|nr:DUF2141 domain-containing protein [Blastomonas aquatica]GGB72587.1 hypothetical protein GCM10010833_29740 [Blastomonas aquatica]
MALLKTLALGLAALFALPGAAPLSDIDITIDHLRSSKGLLQLCLTANERSFPDCEDDPAARRLTARAKDGVARFAGLPAGQYALAIVHDENGNNKLDTFAGIPKEGIGFSRNPNFSFGPPRFSQVLFVNQGAGTSQRVTIKYFL